MEEAVEPVIGFQGSAPQHPELLEQYGQRFTQLEPVAGGVCEEESALSSKASILDSSSASRLFFSLSCEVVIAVVGGEGDQEQQGASCER